MIRCFVIGFVLVGLSYIPAHAIHELYNIDRLNGHSNYGYHLYGSYPYYNHYGRYPHYGHHPYYGHRPYHGRNPYCR